MVAAQVVPGTDGPGYDYVGCYKDKSARDLPVRVNKVASTQECYTQCQAQGYSYFGVQWTRECWCGDSYGSYGTATTCNCPASNVGGWVNCVYSVEWTVYVEATPSTTVTDLGQQAFNEQFAKCPVVQYWRDGAVHSVYKRTSAIPSGFDAYSVFTYTWVNAQNQLGSDFEIYDSLSDAENDLNRWTFCNYNDPDVGYPRDCGKSGNVANQWFTFPGGRFNLRFNSGMFELYTGPNCPTSAGPVIPTAAPTKQPTAAPTRAPTKLPTRNPSPAPTPTPIATGTDCFSGGYACPAGWSCGALHSNRWTSGTISGWKRPGSAEEMADLCDNTPGCVAFAIQAMGYGTVGWSYAQMYDSSYAGLSSPQTTWTSCVRNTNAAPAVSSGSLQMQYIGDGCCRFPGWSATNIKGVSTEADCNALCMADPTCIAADIDPNGTEGCYLFEDASGTLTGADVYLSCGTADKCWAKMPLTSGGRRRLSSDILELPAPLPQ